MVATGKISSKQRKLARRIKFNSQHTHGNELISYQQTAPGQPIFETEIRTVIIHFRKYLYIT